MATNKTKKAAASKDAEQQANESAKTPESSKKTSQGKLPVYTR